MFCNRHGFLTRNQALLASAGTSDIDLLASMKALHQAGYSILTFDFRNHGESDMGITGVGLNEYQDVLGAMDYLDSRPDIDASGLAFVSFCMGANSTIVAVSKAKTRFAGVKCLLAFQPISFRIFVRSYLKANYTRWGLALTPLIEKTCRWRGGHPLEEMSPQKFVKDLAVPTLYVQGKRRASAPRP
jgi:pimeloyl-ACP methyl ester carboxylesterase